MKTLLGMETLEPRTLLTGLVGLPITTVLQPPVESTPARAAEVGPMLAVADASTQAPVGPLPEAGVPTGPELPVIDGTVNLPAPTHSSSFEQPKPNSEANTPGEVEPPALSVDSEPAEPPRWESPEAGSESNKDKSGDSLSKPLAPTTANDSDRKPDSVSTPAPSTAWSARADAAIAPPFVSLLTTSSPVPPVKEALAATSLRTSANQGSSELRYFEPLGPSYHDADGLHAEPLSNVAVREMFIAFWLMTLEDKDDVESPLDAVISETSHVSAAAPNVAASDVAAHPQQYYLTAITEQAELVDRALAAISSADEVLREADVVRAVATSPATAASAQMLTFAAASRSSQPASKQSTAAGQPSPPSWQVGMCSLVAMLFSFQRPAEHSQDRAAVRNKARRASA